MDGFFITTPYFLASYILSNLGFICLFFKHISVYTSLPLNAPKLLGGGWVGVRSPEIDKGLGVVLFAEPGKAAGRAHGSRWPESFP